MKKKRRRWAFTRMIIIVGPGCFDHVFGLANSIGRALRVAAAHYRWDDA